MPKIEKSEAQWRQDLSPEEFRILREKGTERAFTGKYEDYKGPGTFVCAGCGQELFDAATKYNSGSGWPSFYQPIKDSAVEEHTDISHGMRRVEITCANCGGHLGHVFPDGPRPTGLRYCINSASLSLNEKK
jgi:peptide-methionine (R)-S-oxide reductase